MALRLFHPPPPGKFDPEPEGVKDRQRSAASPKGRKSSLATPGQKAGHRRLASGHCTGPRKVLDPSRKRATAEAGDAAGAQLTSSRQRSHRGFKSRYRGYYKCRVGCR